jgi:hypothetical protein
MMVNEKMKKHIAVLGQVAPNPRITLAAAFVLATVLSIPVFLILTLVEVLFLCGALCPRQCKRALPWPLLPLAGQDNSGLWA